MKYHLTHHESSSMFIDFLKEYIIEDQEKNIYS